MSLTVALASDRPPDDEAFRPERVYAHMKKLCRQSDSPAQMAVITQGLHDRVMALDQSLNSLVKVQLPALRDEPHLNEGEHQTAQLALNPVIAALGDAEQRLAHSLRTSAQVTAWLMQPNLTEARGRRRQQAVAMCAGDQTRLTSIVVTTVDLMSAHEATLAEIALLVVEATYTQPST